MAGDLLARVTRNTGILVVARVGEKVLNFLLVVVLIRHLSADAFGQYGFVSAYVVLFNVLVGLGFAALCTREIARTPGDAGRILTAAVVPMAATSVLTVAVISVSIGWSKAGQSAVIVATHLAALDLVFVTFANLFDTVPRAHERMGYSVAPRVVRAGLLLGLCAVGLPAGLGLVGVFVLVAVTGGLQLVLQVGISARVFGMRPVWPFDRQLSLHLLRQAWPLAFSSLFLIIYYKIDHVMLSYLRGDREVGLYVAATALAFAPLFVGTAYQHATYPVLVKLAAASRSQLRAFYRRSLKYLAMAGLPLAAGLAVLAPRVVVLVYDERYLAAAPAMQVLLAALFLMFLNGQMGYALIGLDDQKSLMRIVGGGALLNVALNLVVIPRHGIVGAAAATAVAEFWALAATAWALGRRHGIRPPLGDLARVGACGAGMVAVLVVVPPWPLPVLVPLAALVYGALLLATGALDRDEVRRLRQLATGADTVSGTTAAVGPAGPNSDAAGEVRCP